MVPSFNLPDAIQYSTVINEGKNMEMKLHKGDLDDTIVIQYTGGTTGVSKGAELTNKNLLA